MTTKRLNRAGLARALGVSKSAVTRAIKSGRITPDAEGKFDLAEATRQWRARTRLQLPADESLRFWQEVKTYYRARLAKLEYQHQAGELLDKPAVDYFLNDVGTTLRVLLEGVADQLAPLLVATGDEDKCRRIVAREALRVLHDFEAHAARALHELERGTP